MVSYLITGASQGLGFAFVEALSQNPSNTVIGVVRNKAALEEKVRKSGFKNVHVVQGDINSTASIEAAAEATSNITGGSLDVLINNAALVTSITEWKTLSDFDENFQELEKDFVDLFQANVLGLVRTVHAFLPLIRKGTLKKVVNLGTAHADYEATNRTGLAFGSVYASTKSAAVQIIAKYNAAHKSEGILFLTISPGFAMTERNAGSATEKDAEAVAIQEKKFVEMDPDFKPSTPLEAATAVLKVLGEKSVDGGDGGGFISHHGNKKWF